jgi:Flp pilus assembly protein TadD
MLDAGFFDSQPAGPHLVNLLFHLANTVLVFVLFRRLTGAVWRSAFVAALFALHPLHVESVAWVAERKDLLCAFFSLLALLAYVKAVDKRENPSLEQGDGGAAFMPLQRSRAREPAALKRRQRRAPGSRAWTFYSLALFFFALALMSKPMAVTLPFVLLLLDWWPLNRVRSAERGGRSPGGLLLEKVPFFIIATAASVVTFLVQKSGGAVGSVAMFSIPVRIENAFVSYARYVGKTLWPATLANPYPHPGHWPPVPVLLSVLLFLAICLAAVLGARKWPFVFTGWFWFAGMLLPVIGLVQVGLQAMADRYTYLPSIGLFVVFVWGAGALAARLRAPKALLAVVSLAVVAACAVRTQGQLAYWQNDGTLFTHALAVTKNNCNACVNLGSWYLKNGQNQAALQEYQAAAEMRPSDPLVLYDLGNAFASLGDYDTAIANYRRALDVVPGRPNILNNLGCALMAQGRLPEAITNFEAALAVKPDFAYARNSLGTAFARQDRFKDAAEQYAAAVKMAPDNPGFIENLGDVWVRLGKPDAAAACYERALQLAPDNGEIAGKLNALRQSPAP